MRTLAGLIAALAIASACRAQDAEWRVPFISTPDEVVARMLGLAGTRADDYVVDLGSGDGRIVIAAAQRFGARGLGIELDGELVKASRANARRAGVAERVQFVQGDVLTADFSAASVVTVYLLPELIGKLQSRFVSQLKPGTRIVSHAFRMSGWAPVASETLRVAGTHPGQGDESTLYLWIVPAQVRGTWAGSGVRVRIDQSYGDIDVERATQATLRGNDIAWQTAQGSFRGRVEGTRIEGELTAGARVTPLVLTRER
jgi:precorrin-6B methylase 2